MKTALMLVLLALAAPAGGVAQTPSQENLSPDNQWKVDYKSSRLGFVGRQGGAAFEGAFGTFTAEIAFDPARLEDARITVDVDVASARTGDRQKDKALPGGDWFGAREHPKAQFRSETVRKTGERAYEAAGELSLRGVSHPVVLPFTLEIDGANAHAKGVAKIDRTEFGVGRGEFADGTWVDVSVEIVVDIRASKP